MNLLRTTALATASLLAASLLPAAPAHAVEPEWRQTIIGTDGEPADIVAVAASPTGLTYVLAAGQLTALDTATGAVRWSVTDGIGLSGHDSGHLAIDPDSGRVWVSTLATSVTPSWSVIQSVEPDGTVAWRSEAPGPATYTDLAGGGGSVCASGDAGAVGLGVVACWDAAGRTILDERLGTRKRSVYPVALDLDGRRGRVYLAADTEVSRGQLAPVLTTLSLDDGRTRRRMLVPATDGSVVDLAVDERRGRVHVVARAGTRTVVSGFRAGGSRVYRTVSADGGRPVARYVDVLPRSGRVVVTGYNARKSTALFRVISGEGRVLRTRTVELCCESTTPVVDRDRDRLLLVAGASFSAARDRGASALAVDRRGDVVSTVALLPPGDRTRVLAPAYDASTRTLVTGSRSPSFLDPDAGLLLAARMP